MNRDRICSATPHGEGQEALKLCCALGGGDTSSDVTVSALAFKAHHHRMSFSWSQKHVKGEGWVKA